MPGNNADQYVDVVSNASNDDNQWQRRHHKVLVVKNSYAAANKFSVWKFIVGALDVTHWALDVTWLLSLAPLLTALLREAKTRGRTCSEWGLYVSERDTTAICATSADQNIDSVTWLKASTHLVIVVHWAWTGRAFTASTAHGDWKVSILWMTCTSGLWQPRDWIVLCLVMLSSSRLSLGHLATLQRLRSCLLAAAVSLGANSF